MSNFSTNALLDLCRFGVSLKNEQADTAANELCSYIVFASLMDEVTELPEILLERVTILQDAKVHPELYPQDMFDEEVPVEPEPAPEPPPQVA